MSVIQNPMRDVTAPKFSILVPKSIVTLPRKGTGRVTIGEPSKNARKEDGQEVSLDFVDVDVNRKGRECLKHIDVCRSDRTGTAETVTL